MLYRRMISPTVLEVREELLGPSTTKVNYWYYDIENWLSSQLGREGEAPSTPMAQGSIDWVKKYHIPKATPFTG